MKAVVVVVERAFFTEEVEPIQDRKQKFLVLYKK